MTLDNTILVGGGVLLAILLVLVARKQFYRSLPFFFFYQVWCLSSTALAGLAASLSAGEYFRLYLASSVMDALFQLSVLYEVMRTVAVHNRIVPPTWRLFALLLIPEALLLRSLSSWPVPEETTDLGILYVRIQQTLPILLLAFLLSVIFWSRFRSLHWTNPALHIASGLGFYFLVCLTVAIVHTHQSRDFGYHLADELQAGSYVGVLVYWILKL
jgi:hypothetical protein